MPQVTFIGAGSTIFVRNTIGDCMRCKDLRDSHIALYDIDPVRLNESVEILKALNRSINDNRMTFECFCGEENRPQALAGADFVVNAIQVGGY